MGGLFYLGLYITGVVLYVRYAWRKSERNWEDMMERERKHNEWMVEFGRLMERCDQGRKLNDHSNS